MKISSTRAGVTESHTPIHRTDRPPISKSAAVIYQEKFHRHFSIHILLSAAIACAFCRSFTYLRDGSLSLSWTSAATVYLDKTCILCGGRLAFSQSLFAFSWVLEMVLVRATGIIRASGQPRRANSPWVERRPVVNDQGPIQHKVSVLDGPCQ
ncbi:hypothetical protein JAAARDRAFT_591352 [Jaapia argillacea MUCL 33604]|uniref:Uncharacterized protein n=1 Tax=Jaapia argillacea MUCL 33604 TaxID=933084 RepID=A0A067P5A1_9AGAM|nr:hypothetical protein JAAARDRAFT_591352 [Jaapia argillacea MUCL 33604]